MLTSIRNVKFYIKNALECNIYHRCLCDSCPAEIWCLWNKYLPRSETSKANMLVLGTSNFSKINKLFWMKAVKAKCKIWKRKQTESTQFQLFIFYKPACFKKKFHGTLVSIRMGELLKTDPRSAKYPLTPTPRNTLRTTPRTTLWTTPTEYP